jgi:hypothetical protein
MPDPALILRRAKICRESGSWKDKDYDVFERVYRSAFIEIVP